MVFSITRTSLCFFGYHFLFLRNSLFSLPKKRNSLFYLYLKGKQISFPLCGFCGFPCNHFSFSFEENWNPMAEVLSKTNLFSSCHHGRRAGLSSAFPKKSCNYKPSSSVRWFQPLKLKSHAVRSSSLSSSDFHGNRLVIHANRTIPKRFQPPIYAQVVNFLAPSSPVLSKPSIHANRTIVFLCLP